MFLVLKLPTSAAFTTCSPSSHHHLPDPGEPLNAHRAPSSVCLTLSCVSDGRFPRTFVRATFSHGRGLEATLYMAPALRWTLAQAEANGYKRWVHFQRDRVRHHEKHAEKTSGPYAFVIALR